MRVKRRGAHCKGPSGRHRWTTKVRVLSPDGKLLREDVRCSWCGRVKK